MSGNILQPLVDTLWNVPTAIRNIIHKLPEVVPYEIPNKEYRIGDISIPIGVTSKDVCYLNIDQRHVNVAVSGTTGFGKSNLINSIICSITMLYPSIRLMLIDGKAVELSQYKSMSNVESFTYQLDNINTTINDIYQNILSTYEHMMQEGKRQISIYEPRHITIIDEISLIDKKSIKILEKCMALGRACGYHFIICSQRLDATSVITPVMRNLIDTNIVFKLDTNTSKLTIGTDEASVLSIQGRGIMKIGDIKVEFQSYYITQEQINEVVKLNSNIKKKCKEKNVIATENTKVISINKKHKLQVSTVKCNEEEPKVNTEIDSNTEIPDWVKTC